jgi:hypothetical protein
MEVHRIQFKFWLNIRNPFEGMLADDLALTKQARKYSETIRMAIWLYLDLKQGKTDVLAQLFPWVLATVVTTARPVQIATPITDNPLEMELDIRKATSDEHTGYNMVISMALCTNTVDSLPSDVLEYGIKKGKLSPALGKSKSETSGAIKEIQGSNIAFTVPDDPEDSLLDLLTDL